MKIPWATALDLFKTSPSTHPTAGVPPLRIRLEPLGVDAVGDHHHVLARVPLFCELTMMRSGIRDSKRLTLNVSRLALAGGGSWTVEAPPHPEKTRVVNLETRRAASRVERPTRREETTGIRSLAYG